MDINTIIYIFFIILGLIALIFTGITFRGGSNNKVLLWIIYTVNIILLVLAVYLMHTGSKKGAGITLLLQFIFYAIALGVAHSSGNIVNNVPGYTASGTYAATWIFVILAFLNGILVVWKYTPE
jgi:hypothetical protein